MSYDTWKLASPPEYAEESDRDEGLCPRCELAYVRTWPGERECECGEEEVAT